MMERIKLLLRRLVRESARTLVSTLPREYRFGAFRAFVDCNPAPSERLVLKIAETKEELEASFAVLHDAYVDSGFMKPHPSGMRVTIYHALPTTTTLCAKYDGEVVGTISLIRESALGFPLQRIVDLAAVREKEGQIAEVSALAIHRRFRKTGGTILFPLMKFMYDYCTTFFDTRHLVIAVNPSHIEMYEALLFFKRLTAKVVENYDFVNGAPAIAATLDLKEAPRIFRKHYAAKPLRRNLHAYFMEVALPNIQFPSRRFFTTNDPVLTPELLDYFFNVRTRTFADLSERKKALLQGIYDLPQYRAVLPTPFARSGGRDDQLNSPVRHHPRFSVKCPGEIRFAAAGGEGKKVLIRVFEVSSAGFQAASRERLPLDTECEATIRLGESENARIKARIIREARRDQPDLYTFRVFEPDLSWRKFVSALCGGTRSSDLDHATRFLESRFLRPPTKAAAD